MIAPGDLLLYSAPMISSLGLFRTLPLVCVLALTGCWSSDRSQLDEEKESHYIAGKKRAGEMDYSGAIESFEKALEVNPRSASAHFELGLLYEKSEQDFAAAIYHFERFLRLRPKSDFADVAKGRILAWKQELAKTVTLDPVTQNLQSDFEKLAEENKRLREQLEHLRALSSSNSPAVASRTATPSGASAARAGADPVSHVRTNVASAELVNNASRRTHTIKAGETPTGIARRYGVKVELLMAANPKLDARRLQVGQTLNVPMP
jgi:LysM repeat protein